jgi:EpsD family peptidyl-prolyl cis-trans isomerase
MRSYRGRMLVICACLAFGGCRLPWAGQPKAPTGQVVATVSGEEITLRELNAELRGAQIQDPKQRKAAEQAALDQIITRKVLAKAAHDAGLDKGPDFALRKQRAMDIFMAQLLQERMTNAVPATTRDEADRFVSNHPEMFAQRKILEIDQIRAQGPISQAQLKQLQPLNTLDDIQAWLVKNNIQYRRGSAELDPVSTDPNLMAGILKLPPGEVFVVPAAPDILINRIVSTRSQPLTGDAAATVATQYLTQQHTREAVGKQMGGLFRASVSSVVYNPAYRPAIVAKPAPGKPQAAPASSAPPAASSAPAH